MVLTGVDTFTFLLGDWTIERRIEDHRDAAITSFSGTAGVRLSDRTDGAIYREAGTVRRGAYRGPARRRLQLERQPDGRVRLDFFDGRPFIDLDLTGGFAEAVHPCRADVYRMRFELRGPNALAEFWTVQGPEKDYVAETLWSRRRGTNPVVSGPSAAPWTP